MFHALQAQVYQQIAVSATPDLESVQAVFAVLRSLSKLCKHRLDKQLLPAMEGILGPVRGGPRREGDLGAREGHRACARP